MDGWDLRYCTSCNTLAIAWDMDPQGEYGWGSFFRLEGNGLWIYHQGWKRMCCGSFEQEVSYTVGHCRSWSKGCWNGVTIRKGYRCVRYNFGRWLLEYVPCPSWLVITPSISWCNDYWSAKWMLRVSLCWVFPYLISRKQTSPPSSKICRGHWWLLYLDWRDSCFLRTCSYPWCILYFSDLINFFLYCYKKQKKQNKNHMSNKMIKKKKQ